MAETGFETAVEQTGAMKNMTADETVKMIRELCAQLAASEGSFHGNIWPGSVTQDGDGRAVLAEGSDAPVSERDAEQVEYLAPEFFWENSGTPASDVYSLGMMLYAGCSNGYLPFQPKGGALTDKDRSAALRKRMKGESFKLPTGVSKELRAVVRKALSYDPESRYQTPAELLEALNATDEALPGLNAAAEAAPAASGDEMDEALREEYARLSGDAESVSPDAAETAAEAAPAEKKYTVQKDFEKSAKNKKKSAPSVAPETRKKKKTSPAIPILCVAAAAVIAGGVGWGVTRGGSRHVSEPFAVEETEAPDASEPVVIHTTDSPVATIAPIPLELVPAEDEKDAEADKADEKAEEEEPVATGSLTVDGQDVEPLSDTVYVSGSGVNLRSGPGTSYGVEKTLTRGTKLQRTGTVNGWSQVQYDGAEYYISTNLIQSDDPFGGTAQSLANDGKDDDTKTETSTDDGKNAANGSPAANNTGNSGANSNGAAGNNAAANTGNTGTGSSGTSTSAGSGTTSSTSGNGTSSSTSGTTGKGTGSTSSNRPTVLSSPPVTVTAKEDVVAVTGKEVNLRSGAGTNNSVVGSVTSGTVLQRTGTAGDWSRVVYDGKEVYISSNLIETVASDKETDATGTLKVTADVNVRSGASTGNSIYGVAKKGETLQVTGIAEGGKWYRVSYSGKTGYVNRKLVEIQSLSLVSDQSGTGKVNSDANVRSGPGTDYGIIGDVKAGDTVTITGIADNGWYRISSAGGKTGYIAGSLVDKQTGSSTPSSSSGSSATGTGKANSDANVRSGPGTENPIIGDVKAGDSVSITGTEGSWYKIDYKGRTGYIASSLVDRSGSGTAPKTTSATTTTTTGKANSDANVRSAPGTENPIIGDVKAGDTVEILGTDNGWYRVSVNGKNGYIAGNLVDEIGTAVSGNAAGRANSDANIRAGAGTDYAIVGDVPAGGTFTILETETNNWYKIEYNGVIGYIAGGLVEKA